MSQRIPPMYILRTDKPPLLFASQKKRVVSVDFIFKNVDSNYSHGKDFQQEYLPSQKTYSSSFLVSSTGEM